MSGVSVSVTLEDKQLRASLLKLERVVANPTPIMRAIGTGLVDGTHQRFSRAVSPEGESWKPLSPGYAAIKRGAGILRGSAMSGGLMGSITMRASSDSVEVGTNKIYAAIHQFGGTIKAKTSKGLFFHLGNGPVRPQSVTIPARPFIGISRDDEETTLDVVEGAIKRATT